MLRNPAQRVACQCVAKSLHNHKRNFQHGFQLYQKNSTNSSRQGKIMTKLFGNRLAGSKKRWFPNTGVGSEAAPSAVVFRESKFGQKSSKRNGKNDSRRVTVLNKLFMTHVTDMMATGEISESLLGRGLQITRVKISEDFGFVSVFWLTSGDMGKDFLLEHELHKCSGQLRHELSQLGLMGVVPRIKFVKDRMFTNVAQVEALLQNMDFGVEQDEQDEEKELLQDYAEHGNDIVKRAFFGTDVTSTVTDSEMSTTKDFKLPEMRHDVLGLDHKGIMFKILTKMRKSKQAWELHHQQSQLNENVANAADETTTNPPPTFKQLLKINEELAKDAEKSEKFKEFLVQRRDRKQTPERKKFRLTDHVIDSADGDLDNENILTSRQRQLYEAEDYLNEDVDEKKK